MNMKNRKSALVGQWKKALCWVIMGCTMGLLGACKGANYADQLQEEKDLIDAYIKREKINIVPVEPERDAWGEKDYVRIGDYCYFHLSKVGDTASVAVATGDKVLLRYKQYTIDGYPTVIANCWTTNESADPVEFVYGVSSNATCAGWLLAIPVLKYNGAEGKLICPSKLGFTSTNYSSVTPYGYDLKIQVRKF